VRQRRVERDVGDHFAVAQRMFLLGRGAGQQVKIEEVDVARAAASLYVDGGADGRHRHAHILRMRGDAVFAAAEHRVDIAVLAADRGTAGARRPLVASRNAIAEVAAPHSLHDIAGGRGLVAQLRAGPESSACDSSA